MRWPVTIGRVAFAYDDIGLDKVLLLSAMVHCVVQETPLATTLLSCISVSSFVRHGRACSVARRCTRCFGASLL